MIQCAPCTLDLTVHITWWSPLGHQAKWTIHNHAPSPMALDPIDLLWFLESRVNSRKKKKKKAFTLLIKTLFA